MSSNIGHQILMTVARRVEDLNLDDIRDANVQIDPLTADQIRPGVYITPPTKGNGEWETFPTKTNERQVVGYGCQITVVHGSLNKWSQDPKQITDWRQAVRRAFHDRRLEWADGEIIDPGFNFWGPCKVTPAAFDWDPFEDNDKWNITALVVRVFVLEARFG